MTTLVWKLNASKTKTTDVQRLCTARPTSLFSIFTSHTRIRRLLIVHTSSKVNVRVYRVVLTLFTFLNY